MNKYIKHITAVLGVAVMLFATSCGDDIADEITSLETSRLFSPTNLTIVIRNQVNAAISWKKVNNAKSYTLELFENGNENYEGTPLKSVADITSTSYVINGLLGEENYSLRVKAVGEGIADSKWTSETFKTDAEQIFYAIDPAEIKKTEVTLRWPEGETATTINVTPGDIVYTLTAEDIAAGAATITGLQKETDYTAKLLNGTRTRGTLTFKTKGDTTPVSVEDDLVALLKDADEGTIFSMLEGTYEYPTLTIEKNVTFKADNSNKKPILKSTIFHVKAGAALTLESLILDGTASSGDQAIVYDEDGEYGALTIKDCEIANYTKGTLYVNKKCNIVSVTITNNVYSNIECNGGDFIDFRNGIAQTFEYTNNTAYNSALGRDFFRMDAGGSTNFPGVTSKINISNNTFNNVTNNKGKRILYIRLASHEITFNKNILANTEGYYSNQTSTTIKEMKDNNYFKAPNFTASTQDKAINDAGTYTELDPGFKDAAKGDFTISNQDLIDAAIGDSRWR
ncbi:DUF4957 domain-containing protein [Bacteroides sp. 519]|uniref:DUF4957 domain-containing protein n=1 Tax=Bacteroides sp. 519 TaxID=2302937 RepID=UPI0013D64499|nr:DUF4957 domain-containing protein [Bacteroides sp. 519]NDV57181.1 fibronectin type III domain-containing protein [Bacteroides sp. 519]